MDEYAPLDHAIHTETRAKPYGLCSKFTCLDSSYAVKLTLKIILINRQWCRLLNCMYSKVKSQNVFPGKRVLVWIFNSHLILLSYEKKNFKKRASIQFANRIICCPLQHNKSLH